MDIENIEPRTAESQPFLDSDSFELGTDEDSDFEVDLKSRAEAERLLLRKLDRRMSILVVIYILNYIDRNNVQAARLRGFEEDLHLKGSQYASLLSILYVGYTLMQIPSNMFLNHTGKPSKYLPACMIVWGALSVGTGFTTNYYAAIVTRFFVGFVEAAYFPGAMFLLTKWYKRNELSQRTAYFASGMMISNAFGSLIASAILDSMNGVLGFTAWRWLFFIEGGLTIIIAGCALKLFPDFPETTVGWLTPAEKELAIRRMVEDNDHDHDDGLQVSSRLPGLFLAVKDWKVWWLTLTSITLGVAVSFASYFPTLSATLGYGPTVTLLLCAPPWLFATFTAIALSKHSDKVEERCKHIAFSIGIGIIGFLMAMSTMNTIIRYISLFFMAQMYGAIMCLLAWSGNSFSDPATRAVALAFINCISSAGSIIGFYIWPVSWGPTYNVSYAVCIFTSALCIAMCFIFRQQLLRLNRVADNDIELGERNVKTRRYMV